MKEEWCKERGRDREGWILSCSLSLHARMRCTDIQLCKVLAPCSPRRGRWEAAERSMREAQAGEEREGGGEEDDARRWS